MPPQRHPAQRGGIPHSVLKRGIAVLILLILSVFLGAPTAYAVENENCAFIIRSPLAQAKKFIILLRVIGLGRMRRWFAVKTTQQYLRNVNTKKGIKRRSKKRHENNGVYARRR